MSFISKARVKKTRKQREALKPSKEPMIKEEPDKENANKVTKLAQHTIKSNLYHICISRPNLLV